MQLFSTYLDSLVQRFLIKGHTTNITENNKIIHSKGLFAMCTCVVAHNGIISSIAVAVISASATRARAHQQTAENIPTGILLLIRFFLSLFYLFALPLVVILLLHFSLALHAFHENTRCIFSLFFSIGFCCESLRPTVAVAVVMVEMHLNRILLNIDQCIICNNSTAVINDN